jgi:hypothetical protein
MKIIRRLLKWTLISILSLVLIVLLLLAIDDDYQKTALPQADKQAIQARKEFAPKIDSSLYPVLLRGYGKNKKLAEGFELQCLLALSHYPELKEVPIDFQIKPSDIPLASRPAPMSVLFPWKQRKYLVIISNKPNSSFEPILLKNTPFNAQVGIIGHELAHSVYYQDKSAFQLVAIAYKYTNNRLFHKDFERNTDKRAIAHGLGHQLYDFAYYARKSFGQTEQEIQLAAGGTYLSPGEILTEIKKYPFYTSPTNDASTPGQ